MPQQPGIRRCCTPSRSLYWFARKRTSACETVSRTVPTSPTSSGHRLLGPPPGLAHGGGVGGGGVAETLEPVELLVLVLNCGAGTELHRSVLPQWISGSGMGGPASRKSKSHPS